VGIPISEVCIIHAIAVSPEYQGHGIGTQLLSQLQSKCENEGAGKIAAGDIHAYLQ